MAGGFEALVMSVGQQGTLDRKVEALLAGMTERLKATSNDQNVQALARELRAASLQLVEAIVAKTYA